MKKRNAKRGGHAFPKNVDMAYRAWIRERPCLVGGPWRAKLFADKQGRFYEHVCLGAVQVCHVKSRGAGGPDHNNCVPMCMGAHDQQHRIGIRSFEKRWGVNLTALAQRLTADYQTRKGLET